MAVLRCAAFITKHIAISAYLVSDPELILRQTRALDRVPCDQRGRLHGVAMGIEDIMDTKGELSAIVGRDIAHSIKICQQNTVLLYTGQMPIAQLLRHSEGLEP